MLKSILPLSLATFLSRISGFIRDYALYKILEPGPVLDVFFVAFRFPQLSRRFFAEGSFHQALLPVMGEAVQQKDIERMNRLYSQSFWFLTAVMTLLTMSIWGGGPQWVRYILAPGFVTEQQNLLVDALNWTSPYTLALSWVSIYALLLQLHHSYWLNGLSPSILNIGVLWAAWYYDGNLEAIVKSVFFTGWLQVILQAGYAYMTLPFPLKLSLPRTLDMKDFFIVLQRFGSLSGLSVLILFNLSVDQIFLSYAPVGSVSVYYLCERLIELPIGILGYSLWSVFSTYYVRYVNNPALRIRLEHKILLLIVFLVGPAAAGIFIFAPEFMTLFIAPETVLFTNSVALLHIISLQILMIVLNKIFVIIFTTKKRNSEILKIHLIGSTVNLAANAMLYPFGARGIALSTVVTLLAQLSLFYRSYPFMKRFIRLPIALWMKPMMALIGFVSLMLMLPMYLALFFPVKNYFYYGFLLVGISALSSWYLWLMQPFFEYLNKKIIAE